jgi:hypothetical protein
MGSGVSKNDIVTQFKEKLKTHPSETISVYTLCKKHVEEEERTKALMYAKKMSTVFIIPSNEEIEHSFTLLDYNNNAIISLAEIDKYIVERYPALDNKPALMRAYHATDSDQDGFINKKEYCALFHYIEIYTKLWNKFEKMDANGDRRIERCEFELIGQSIFGNVTNFDDIDTNNGGMILFKEFCDHIIQNIIREKNL